MQVDPTPVFKADHSFVFMIHDGAINPLAIEVKTEFQRNGSAE